MASWSKWEQSACLAEDATPPLGKPTGPGSFGASALLLSAKLPGAYKLEERIVWVALSEDAKRILMQLGALEGKYEDRWVPDEILLEAPEISPVAYDDAVGELIKEKLAEAKGQTSDGPFLSDRPFLRATPKGRRLTRELQRGSGPLGST